MIKPTRDSAVREAGLNALGQSRTSALSDERDNGDEADNGQDSMSWIIPTVSCIAVAALLGCVSLYWVRSRQQSLTQAPGRATRKAQLAELGESSQYGTGWPDDDQSVMPPRRRTTRRRALAS